MARDLRQTTNLNNYPDRCNYYDTDFIDKNKMEVKPTPLGRFYKRDKVPFHWERVSVNGVFTSRKQFIGVIETTDHVEKIRPDMFVIDQTGMLFRVDTNIISDDENRSKNVGRRPCIKTTMTLIGVEQEELDDCE